MPKGHYDHQPRVDLTGQVFGDWTVLHRGILRGQEGRRWLCRCSCGIEREVAASSLDRGLSTSCGCAGNKRAALKRTIHGMSKSVEHRTWRKIWDRCTNPTTTKWELYGGKGIKVCDRWLSFENFYADMGPRPEGCSIDRIDSDGDYEPGNCRWATIKQQNRNTSRNRMLTYQGETLSLAEWAERMGLNYSQLSNRIAYGWSVERALTAPSGRWASRNT